MKSETNRKIPWNGYIATVNNLLTILIDDPIIYIHIHMHLGHLADETDNYSDILLQFIDTSLAVISHLFVHAG